ncbi:NPC intracellular cholesterol transporter 1-like [Sycon ciliatum]|uniref:NPC intracellular cholesterol transporter 1-like n=1 Tax=Sycon ciliatum TaxID=27933 RepID=UPI0031F6DD92
MRDPRQRLRDFADRVFVGYANLVVRRPAVIGLCGLLLAVAFSLGLLIVDVEKRDLNALWIDLDSRVVDERKVFEDEFGGLTRKTTCAVSVATLGDSLFPGSNETSATTARTTPSGNALDALQGCMKVWQDTEVTMDNKIFVLHDVCERPQVPVLFQPGQSSAQLYSSYTRCLQANPIFQLLYQGVLLQYPWFNPSFSALKSAWGLTELPCSRASVLDCFREGQNIDWPEGLRELDSVSAAAAASLTTTYGALAEEVGAQPIQSLTVSAYLTNSSLFPCWLLRSDGNITCLGEMGHFVLEQGALIRSLYTVEPFFSAIGASSTTLISATIQQFISQVGMATNTQELQTIAKNAHQTFFTLLGMAAQQDREAASLVAYMDLLTKINDLPTRTNEPIGSECVRDTSMAYYTDRGQTPSTQEMGQAVGQLRTAILFLGSLGYWWRPSYQAMSNSDILEHINMATHSQINPAVRNDPTACLSGEARCCQQWSSATIATSLMLSGQEASKGMPVAGTGFSSKVYKTITTIRLGAENYNENNPFWIDQMKAAFPTIDWTKAKREELMEKLDEKMNAGWLKMYKREVGSNYSSGEAYSSFRLDFSTGSSLTDILKEASELEGNLIGLSYGVMAALVVLSLGNYLEALVNIRQKDCAQRYMVDSHGILGLCGVLVVALSSVAGLGFSSYVQITFNPLTTSLVPFVALGLGVDDMFVFAHAVTVLNDRSRSIGDNMCAVMRLAGPSVCLTSVANAVAFILIYYVPVAAVRQLVLVLMISVLANLVFLFLLFVPIMVFDLKRNHAGRMDLIFVKASAKLNDSERSDEEKNTLVGKFIDKVYAPVLSKAPVKVAVLLLFSGFFCWTLYNAIENTKQGLRVSDIALKDSYQRDMARLTENEITTQSCYLMAVTKNYSFSNAVGQQRVMDALNTLDENTWRIRGMRLNDANFLTNGSSSLLGFYSGIQQSGALNPCPAANVSTPIAVPQCYDTFFKQWYASVGPFYAPFLVCHDANGMRVGCNHADASVHAVRTPFNLDRLYTHDDHISAIEATRARVDPLNDDKMQLFSIGYIFYFWEQYFGIVNTLIAAIGFGLLGVFFVTFIFQLNPWLSAIVCLIILMIDIELIGLMDPIGVKLNAISIANLVVSIGMAVEFTAHYARAFLLAQGNRNERMKTALHEMLKPMFNGALSTIIALSVLSMARFPFFRIYYAITYVLMVIIAFANGLVLLPVLLSVIGPGSQAAPAGHDYDKQTDEEMHALDSGKQESKADLAAAAARDASAEEQMMY